MKIQLLISTVVPRGRLRWQNLQAACALEGLTWSIELVEVCDDDDAAARRFLDSPSIVIDGQDLWPRCARHTT